VTATLSPDGTKLQVGARVVDGETLAVAADRRDRFPNIIFARGSRRGAHRPARRATWLGGGLVALTGLPEHLRFEAGRIDYRAEPAGLSIVNVRTWQTRLVARDVTDVTLAGALLLARNTTRGGTPVRGFDVRGRLRTTLRGIDSSDVLQPVGARLLAANRLLELLSGRMLRGVPARPRVLVLPTDRLQFPR
jgi:hypothetical protein